MPGGSVLWLTGLSGAGKTTVARELQQLFINNNEKLLILDGDIVRSAIQDPHWKFDAESRKNGSYRYARLAQLAASQGLTVLVPTISMFDEVRAWNRAHIINYFEVYLHADLENLQQRDHKALYKNFNDGKASHMAGLDVEVELPKCPDLTIDNNGDRAKLTRNVEKIFNAFNQFRKEKQDQL